MNDEKIAATSPSPGDDPGPRRNGHGLSRRARLGVAAVALVGLGAIAGSLATVSASAGAHMFRGHHGASAAEMTERARDRVSWVLARVDATDEQERQVDAIVSDLMASLAPVRTRHHEHRQELVSELLRDPVDSARLETIRRQELELADAASASVLDAIVRTAKVLTPQQREELLERFGRRHH